jgi:signal peptidase I
MTPDEPKDDPSTPSDRSSVWSESPGPNNGSAGDETAASDSTRVIPARPDEPSTSDAAPEATNPGAVTNEEDETGGSGVPTAPSPAVRKAYTAPVPPDPKKSKKKFAQRSLLAKITEIPILVLMAFVIAVIIKTFLVQAFYIPSESMLPTLRVGDRVLVEKVGYLFDDVSRGDVVVFEKEVFGAQTQDLPWHQDARNLLRELLGLPTGQEEDYIKRVVAIGGDVIQYSGQPRRLLINGERVEEPFIRGGRDAGSPALTSDDCRRLEMESSGKGCRVPAGTVFVMGDNRGNSEDSRVIGPVSEDKIIGKAFIIIWPPGDIGTL